MRLTLLALALVLFSPSRAAAEWQLRPSLGVTFGGGTTFVDLERAAGKPNVAICVTGVLLGEVIGIDADLGYAPGFFQAGDEHLVLRSRATTLTANIVIALPRRMTQYTLRPYVVGGAGIMHADINWVGGLGVTSTLPAMDVGGGVTGFLTDRVGLNWDVRHFRSIGRKPEARGVSLGAEQLSFWRANMALAIRY